MDAVGIVMQMFNAMNAEEKKRVIVELGKDDDVKAMQTEVIAETPPAKGGGRSGKRGSRPFWIKSATGIDATKKGMFRVEGDWVQDPLDVKPNTLVIMGAKAPKHYVLGLATGNADDKVEFESLGKMRTIAGVKEVTRGDKFGDIEGAVAQRV